MSRVRTQVSVAGVDEATAREGLPHLILALHERPWLLNTNAFWDAERARLVIVVECDGDNPAIMGGDGGGNFDEISDLIWACVNFSTGTRFVIDESVVLP